MTTVERGLFVIGDFNTKLNNTQGDDNNIIPFLALTVYGYTILAIEIQVKTAP